MSVYLVFAAGPILRVNWSELDVNSSYAPICVSLSSVFATGPNRELDDGTEFGSKWDEKLTLNTAIDWAERGWGWDYCRPGQGG